MERLYDKLKAYSESDYYGFHMPGHKRQQFGGLPYEIDVTEIDGFDDLHHAEGILLDAQKRAAKLYHADETHFLVNGSTVGILSAICGATKKGDTILVARNCHKSVYHAMELQELTPVYLYPGFDREIGLNTQVEVEDVKRALEEHPEIAAIMIVSPTYDGVVSDVEAIAKLAHEQGILLIVDEAHGAHFGFHEAFPQNSNCAGADVVIHSVHKTLPALTQTALLHINGSIVNRDRIRKYLHMLQSSSPSYVLMASIDACMDILQSDGKELFERYVRNLSETREKLEGLRHLSIVRSENFDDSKIVISVRNADITGRGLYQMLLEDYHLQMEMAAGDYVLAMTSIADTKEAMERLTNALFEIDNRIGYKSAKQNEKSGDFLLPKTEAVHTIAQTEALSQDGAHRRRVSWEDALGLISLEYAYLYPPGYPIIVPGERINQEVIELLERYRDEGFSIEGLRQSDYIEVIASE